MLSLPIPAGYHLNDRERSMVRQWIKAQYAQGDSIRTISVMLGRSYGFVRRELVAGGTVMRQRRAQ